MYRFYVRGAERRLVAELITRDDIRAIPDLYKSIQRDMERLYFLREKATSIPSGITEGERVQTSTSSAGNKWIEEAADLSREVEAKSKKLRALQEEADVFISTVNHELTRRVLRCRYIRCFTWDETVDYLKYDLRYLHRLESEAVRTLSGHTMPPITYI